MTGHFFASTFLAASTALALATTATAQEADGWEFDGVPSWNDVASGDSFTFRGRVYLDYGDIDFTTGGVRTGYADSEIRTARLGVTGTVSGVGYVAEFDLINDAVAANDVYLAFDAGPVGIKIGHMKTTNSIEELTSSRYITFMERGLGTDLFGLDRRIGVAMLHAGDGYSLSVGAYGGRPGDLTQSVALDDSWAVSARASRAFTVNDATVHLGASVRHLDYGDAGTRIRVRPQTHITDRIVTADFRPGRALGEADSAFLRGLEFAAVNGPFHVTAEWMVQSMDGPASDPDFDTRFVSFGWFLTGETRSYSARSGKFGRTRPTTAISNGGPGAWEIAVRFDRADLDSVAAGELNTITAGLNWYLEDHVRVMANLVDGRLSVPGAANTDVSGAQLRLQWDF
ncbi:OprO/OprP family phosphate-selective porin [Maricaulis maris]|uniref:Phosphate-selective porin OprO/OprP n=1 Tax=Maricaulis maris TaxID=74318 RepID=A0A495D4L9_9PROT|nr:porin [Maricaulis maris]RKQ96181.1 phosphate-selective porin OprO/OprP [Maricaulis maris]